MNVTPNQDRQAIWWVLSMIAIAGIAGCAGLALTEVAPPVNTSMIDSANDSVSLSRGREIYLSSCVRCHSAQPVRKYSREQWEGILPEMLRQTKLKAGQTAELRSYVLAIIRVGDGSPDLLPRQ